MGFGNRLKCILKNKGITIKELSEITGISINTLYSITKRDTQVPSIEVINKISTALSVPVEYLFDVINMGIMTDRDMEALDYTLSNTDKYMQTLLFCNGYTLIKNGEGYIIQLIDGDIHGKRIKIDEQEYIELSNDIDYFVKFLMKKLMNRHKYYFPDKE